MEEGTNCPYKGNSEPLMIAEKLVSRFEIFTEHVDGIKESIIEEPILEELIQALELERNIPAVELKDTVDQDGERDFESFVLNSIIDVFMMILILLLQTCLRLMIFSFQKLMH